MWLKFWTILLYWPQVYLDFYITVYLARCNYFNFFSSIIIFPQIQGSDMPLSTLTIPLIWLSSPEAACDTGHGKPQERCYWSEGKNKSEAQRDCCQLQAWNWNISEMQKRKYHWTFHSITQQFWQQHPSSEKVILSLANTDWNEKKIFTLDPKNCYKVNNNYSWFRSYASATS